jgi:hypothetical protein
MLTRVQTLAEQLSICDDIAHEKAAYWRAISLPLSSYFEGAKAAAAPYVSSARSSTQSREVRRVWWRGAVCCVSYCAGFT